MSWGYNSQVGVWGTSPWTLLGKNTRSESAMGLGDTFDFYAYAGDDGTTYAIKLSFNVAASGGFSTFADPTSTKVWPYHAKNLRHVLGNDGSGHRTRLPVYSNTTTLYKTGGSFNIGSRTYQVEGVIGEKRKLNSVS
jgi:hypothetical protein